MAPIYLWTPTSLTMHSHLDSLSVFSTTKLLPALRTLCLLFTLPGELFINWVSGLEHHLREAFLGDKKGSLLGVGHCYTVFFYFQHSTKITVLMYLVPCLWFIFLHQNAKSLPAQTWPYLQNVTWNRCSIIIRKCYNYNTRC